MASKLNKVLTKIYCLVLLTSLYKLSNAIRLRLDIATHRKADFTVTVTALVVV